MDLKTVSFEKGSLSVLDQRRLPLEEKRVILNTVRDVYEAITRMTVRGAPLIGIVAAFGAALSIRSRGKDWEEDFRRGVDLLSSSRPTAVNLSWALDRAMSVFNTHRSSGRQATFQALLREAEAIRGEDALLCRRIGENLQPFIKNGGKYLTHCNAGALATAAYGTALSGFYVAREEGKEIFVWVDETRPWLQGLRLTAWELSRGKVPHRVIADSAAAFLIGRGEVDAVFTGADRIAANGDTANKIGTYALSLACRTHGVPLIVAAPRSTLDPRCPRGEEIPIEERSGEEITRIAGIGPGDEEAYNPAFDVTPYEHITAIVTEEGVWHP
jgi:methylthioribose-1-phosphate isomerase